MNERICTVPGCSQPLRSRGYCMPHYKYFRYTARTLPPLPVQGTAERLLAKRVIDGSGCWIWQGRMLRNGYGTIGLHGRSQLVHRVSYREFRGQIPEGLVIDHLCRVPLCFNPDHLEPVTQRTNILRGESDVGRALRSGKCKRGHDRTGRAVGEKCLRCMADHRREYVRRRDAADPAFRQQRLAYNRDYSKRLREVRRARREDQNEDGRAS